MAVPAPARGSRGAKLICTETAEGDRHGKPQVEGVYGSDLYVVTWPGLELSRMTKAAWELGNGLVSGLHHFHAGILPGPQQELS